MLSKPIVTQVIPLKEFYPAEPYHQNFLDRHPTKRIESRTADNSTLPDNRNRKILVGVYHACAPKTIYRMPQRDSQAADLRRERRAGKRWQKDSKRS